MPATPGTKFHLSLGKSRPEENGRYQLRLLLESGLAKLEITDRERTILYTLAKALLESPQVNPHELITGSPEESAALTFAIAYIMGLVEIRCEIVPAA